MKMRTYSADIGSWESGKVIRFRAANHRAALSHASSQGHVVMLRVGAQLKGKNANHGLGTAIYDEINGFYRGVKT
jgi:hypothetical protein